jgi:hypothetical protein
VFREILSKKFDDYTYWLLPQILVCLGEMTIGIACACMPATAGFLNRGNGGRRIMSGLSQIFGLKSLRSKYGKSSDASKSTDPSLDGKPGKIMAKTYINIDHGDSSTQDLHSVELDNYSRV